MLKRFDDLDENTKVTKVHEGILIEELLPRLRLGPNPNFVENPKRKTITVIFLSLVFFVSFVVKIISVSALFIPPPSK